MATRYLVQQQWPNKWGTVAVFRTEAKARAWFDDARTVAPEKSHRVIATGSDQPICFHTPVRS